MQQISVELHLESRVLALFESTDRRTLDKFPQPLDQFAQDLAETYSGDQRGLHECFSHLDPLCILMHIEWIQNHRVTKRRYIGRDVLLIKI